MNTRILRMCRRMPHAHTRLVEDLGQVQPVLFCIERGGVSLRIENAGERYGTMQPCWAVLPLPKYKARAKDLFSHLERCKAKGTRSAASKALDAREARHA
jgi:hypothetical protein